MTNAIYTSLQIGFQALVDAVERGDDLVSLQKKQRGILMLSEMARQLNLLDQERTQALRTLEQLDIQNTVATLGRLLKLQRSLNETTVKDLTQQLENVTFTTERMEETFIKKALLAQQEIEHLKRQQIELKGSLYGFFRKCHWEELLGDVGEEPPLPPDILDILESPCPFAWDKGCKVQDTHKLMLIPATIRGQPVTLNNLVKFLANFDKDIKMRWEFSDKVREEHGDIPIERSYWVLMSTYSISSPISQEHLDQWFPTYSFLRLLEAALFGTLINMPRYPGCSVSPLDICTSGCSGRTGELGKMPIFNYFGHFYTGCEEKVAVDGAPFINSEHSAWINFFGSSPSAWGHVVRRF